MDHAFILTDKQTDKLKEIVRLFYARAQDSPAIPPAFLLLLGGTYRAIEEEDALDQHHIDVVVWMLDLVLSQMEDDEFDPQLERLYCKLTGYWPVNPPWYERVKNKD